MEVLKKINNLNWTHSVAFSTDLLALLKDMLKIKTFKYCPKSMRSFKWNFPKTSKGHVVVNIYGALHYSFPCVFVCIPQWVITLFFCYFFTYSVGLERILLGHLCRPKLIQTDTPYIDPCYEKPAFLLEEYSRLCTFFQTKFAVCIHEECSDCMILIAFLFRDSV